MNRTGIQSRLAAGICSMMVVGLGSAAVVNAAAASTAERSTTPRLRFSTASAAVTLPPAMAALGDSLTRAFGAGGAAQDYPAGSWSTGSDPGASSHYVRLLAAGATPAGRFNDAVSGSKMAATNLQAQSAVSQGAQYVTVWSGTNDVCTSTVTQMTTVAAYTSGLQQTLTTLSNGVPGVQILLVSIPNWYGFWQNFKNNAAAKSAWSAYANRCPDLLSPSATSANRLAFAQRISDLNAAARSVCAAFAGCRYDAGTAYNLWTSLTSSDFTFDFFHLTVAGQAKVASALWSAGFFAGSPQTVLGYPAVGGVSASDGAGYLDASGPWLLTQPGSVSQLQGYVAGGGSAGRLRAVIYADSGGNPGAVVATSNELSVAPGQAAGWVTLTLPTPVSLPPGGYWLGYWYGDSATSISFDSGISSQRYRLATYSGTGSAPATFGPASVGDHDYSLFATIGGALGPPVNTVPPAITGSAQQGQLLTGSEGSWSGVPAPTFTDQWRRCNTAGAACVDIAGATGPSYTLTAADVGSTLRFQVTASNSSGQAIAVSSQTAVVTAASGGLHQLGNTTIGALAASPGAGYKFGSVFTASESGTVADFRVYLRGGSSPQVFRPLVYGATGGVPGALLAVGPEFTVAAGQPAGWVTISLPAFAITGGQSYLLGLISGTAPNQAFIYESTVTGAGHWNPNAYPNPTSPWGADNVEDYLWSMLVDYSPA